MALSISACGKRVAEGTSNSSTTNNNSSTTNNVTNNSNPTPTPTPTSTSGGGGSCSHPIVSYTTPFTYTLTGSGNVTATTTSGQIYADQDLRVQIIPNNSGGLQNYAKFAADVTLLMDGNPVPGATIRLPAQQSNTNNYRTGLAVGSKSNIADFTSYLQSGNHTYSVRVSNVMTDYTCKTYCVPTNTMYLVYMGYYASCGDGTFGYYCPDYTMINACKALQCDVGPVTSGRSWSVTVMVETDNTPCLTQ